MTAKEKEIKIQDPVKQKKNPKFFPTESQALPLELPVRRALGRKDFLISPCNQEAVSWIDEWPAWPVTVLIITGGQGCGKTHLSQIWKEKSHALWLNAPDLQPDLVAELSNGAPLTIVLDDGDKADRKALLDLFNLVKDSGGHLLISARSSPILWASDLPELRSRLLATPCVTIGLPDDQLLEGLLAKLLKDKQIKYDTRIIAYLIKHMPHDFHFAHYAIDAIDYITFQQNMPATLNTIRQIWHQLKAEFQAKD